MYPLQRILAGVLFLISCSLSYAAIPQCLVTASAAQSIPADTSTVLTFASVISDTDTIHGTDNQTFTIHTSGVYSITAFLTTPASYLNLFVGIKINDTYYAGMDQVTAPGAHMTTSAIVKLTSGGTIKVYAYAAPAFNT